MLNPPVRLSDYALVLWKVERELHEAVLASDDTTAAFAIGELVDLALACPRSAICRRAVCALELATRGDMPEPIRREATRALDALALPA